MSKQNQAIITPETHEKGTELRSVAIKLNAAIKRFEDEQRGKSEYPELFDPFESLADLTGIAESTLRSYCNRYNPVFPPLDKFLLICKAIDNGEPVRTYFRLCKNILGVIDEN
jgi:hypothetical protein